MKPLRNYLLIRVDKAIEETKSGIKIAYQWKELPPIGTIEAVGPEVKEKLLKPGIRVVFGRYGATDVGDQDNPDLRLISEDGIWAVINDGKKI